MDVRVDLAALHRGVAATFPQQRLGAKTTSAKVQGKAATFLVGTLERLLQERFQILLLGLEGWSSREEAAETLVFALLPAALQREALARDALFMLRTVQRSDKRETARRIRTGMNCRGEVRANVQCRRRFDSEISKSIFSRLEVILRREIRKTVFMQLHSFSRISTSRKARLQQLSSLSVTMNCKKVSSFFGRWRQRVQQSNAQFAARLKLAVTLLSTHAPHNVLLRRSMRRWKTAATNLSQFEHMKTQATMVNRTLMNYVKSFEKHAWNRLVRHCERKRDQVSAAKCLWKTLLNLRNLYTYNQAFSGLKRYSESKTKLRSVLGRALACGEHKRALVQLWGLNKLHHQVVMRGVASKRKGFRKKQGARSLGLAIKGFLTDRKRDSLEAIRLISAVRQVEASTKMSGMDSLRRNTQMARALLRFRSSLLATAKSSILHWKLCLRTRRSPEQWLRLVRSITRVLLRKNWLLLRSFRPIPQRSATPDLVETRIRSTSRRPRRYQTPDPAITQKLVTDLIQSQAAVQTRVEAILRATESRPKASVLVIKSMQVETEQKVCNLTAVLEKIAVRGAFRAVKRKEPETPKWASVASFVLRKSSLAQFLLNRLVQIAEKTALNSKRAIFTQFLKIATKNKRLTLKLSDLQIVEALLRHRRELARLYALQKSVQKWRQTTRELALRNRRRVIKMASALRKLTRRTHSILLLSSFQELSKKSPSRLNSPCKLISNSLRKLSSAFEKHHLFRRFHSWREAVLFIDALAFRQNRRSEVSSEATRSSPLSRSHSPIVGKPTKMMLLPPSNIHEYLDDVMGLLKDGTVEASYSSAVSSTFDTLTSWGLAGSPSSPCKPREKRRLVKTSLIPPRVPSYRNVDATYRSLGGLLALRRGNEGNDLECMRESCCDNEGYDEFLVNK